jgi:hypothetical protein
LGWKSSRRVMLNVCPEAHSCPGTLRSTRALWPVRPVPAFILSTPNLVARFEHSFLRNIRCNPSSRYPQNISYERLGCRPFRPVKAEFSVPLRFGGTKDEKPSTLRGYATPANPKMLQEIAVRTFPRLPKRTVKQTSEVSANVSNDPILESRSEEGGRVKSTRK